MTPGEACFSAVPAGPAGTLPSWVGLQVTLPKTQAQPDATQEGQAAAEGPLSWKF